MNISRAINKLKFTFSSVKDKIKKEREARLKKEIEVLPLNTAEHLEKIRNIAIIAHIDAGKTTTTERMLYYAGALEEPGDVDDGNTTMDYLPQEKARGITIRSAAISFGWKGHQINVIDTPGHVDFSGEVARSVRVLDGVVTIFDAVNGVQTQTQKVWTQANEKNLPKLCFANKMDRLGSSLDLTVKSIKQRLGADPFVLQYPIGVDQNFRGVVDLVNMTQNYFEGYKGQDVIVKPLNKSNPNYKKYLQARQELIDKVGSYDQKLGDMYLNGTQISAIVLQNSIKRVLSDQKYLKKTCGLLMGTSFKYKGVQSLMDSIIDYLPSPTQTLGVTCIENPNDHRKPLKDEKFCGYVFKNIYDTEKGPLSYVRVYSGTLSKTTPILNSTKNVYEKIQFLYRVRADRYVNVNEVFAGDIIAVSGLKNSGAGDTLINMNDPRFLLEKLTLPSAIFKAPFEANSLSQQSKLQQQLTKIGSQDNSLIIENDPQTRQLVVSGLGQLHLEIIRDRLIDMGINVRMGNLRIGFLQSISQKVRKSFKLKKVIAKQEQQFELQVQIIPIKDQNDNFMKQTTVVFSFPKTQQFDIYWKQFQRRKQQKLNPNQKKTAEDGSKSNIDAAVFGKALRNPIKPTNINQNQQQEVMLQQYQSNQQQQDAKQQQVESEKEDVSVMYHINSLNFEMLDYLVQSIKLSLLSGRYGFPITSVQVNIVGGKYPPNKISKNIISQTASQLMQQIISSYSILLQPMVEVQMIGQQQKIEAICGVIMKKRGRIEERQQRKLKAVVPAEAIRGWVKDIRAMGLDTEIKFSSYEQVQGVDPKALAQNN